MTNLHYFKLITLACITILLGTLLGTPEYTYTNSLFQSIAIYLWSYIGHTLYHKITIIDKVNFHKIIHHDTTNKYSRTTNLIVESLDNIWLFFLLLIPNLFNINIFSKKIVIYSAIWYTATHIFNYSIIKNNYHIQHHKTPEFNYSPEILDMIFDTKYDAKCDNDFSLIKELIPVIIGFIIVLYASKIGINDVISKSNNISDSILDSISDINIELQKTE
jgi:hypothetical protein